MIDGHRVGAHVAAGDEHRAVLADVRLDRHADAFGLQQAASRSAFSCRRVDARRAGRRLKIAAGGRAIGANGVVLLIGLVNRIAPLSLPACAFIAHRLRGRASTPASRRCVPAWTATSRGIADQRHVARLDHFDRDLVERPAAAELERLGVHARSGRIAFICSCVHAIARLCAGELVSRGPIVVVR